MEFLSLLQKYGLSDAFYGISFSSPKIWTSYAISIISIPSQKTWTIICNFGNFFPFSINVNYHMQVSRIPFSYPKTYTILWNLWNFFLFSKNMDYHIQFLDFLSLFKKHGLSYAIFGISFSSPKTWSIICNFRNIYPFSKNMDYHI